MRKPGLHCLLILSPLLSIAQAEQNTVLQIQPGLCVIETEAETCEIPLQAKWLHQAPQPQWCLYQAEQERALYCEDENLGFAQYFRWQARLHGSTWFVLKQQSDAIVVDTAQVKVARLVTDVRPRRRHGWGIL